MKNAILISIFLGMVLLLAGCTSQKTELSGAAGVAQCTDTDGGNTVGVKGTATAAGISRTDVCTAAGALTEYYCSNNKVTSITGKCAAGKVCTNGACVAAPARVQQCKVVNGVVQHTSVNGVVTNYANGCNAQGQTVTYSCRADGSVNNQTVACNAGMMCQAGACVNNPINDQEDVRTCMDTDGGQNPTQVGAISTTLNGNPEELGADECLSLGTVSEVYCDANNEVARANIECAAGMSCQRGACAVTTYSCVDSDGGENTAGVGTTTTAVNGQVNESYVDSCNRFDDHFVLEYFCQATNIKSRTLSCGVGQICQNGACVASLSSCTDTDGGQNIAVVGTITTTAVNGQVNETSRDMCISEITLLEYSCDGTYGIPRIQRCQGGQVCQNGACATPTPVQNDSG